MTGLTKPEITDAIVVDAIITDRCTNSANITDIVESCMPLKFERMADGASIFRTGRYTAANTIKSLTYSAV